MIEDERMFYRQEIVKQPYSSVLKVNELRTRQKSHYEQQDSDCELVFHDDDATISVKNGNCTRKVCVINVWVSDIFFVTKSVPRGTKKHNYAREKSEND